MTRTLAGRIALLVIAVAAVTAAVAGVLAAELVRQTTSTSAQRQLAQLADAAQARANRTDTLAGTVRVRGVLRPLGIEYALLNRRGRLLSTRPAVRRVLTPEEVQAVLSGRSLSLRRDVHGTAAFVEARPTSAGGLVLVQPRSEALASGENAIRRMLLALLVGIAVAVPASVVVSRALARPLRHTVDGARALAGGRRDVRVPVEGPEEVADVASAINSLAASLERSEEQQRSFLLSVSHDLRTPLTALRGYAESLAAGLVTPHEVPQVARVMTGEAERLERLIADLLDLARLGADRFRVELAQSDLGSVVEATGVAWAPRCRAVGVPLRVANTVAGVLVTTDAGRVRQVLDGLLENALRVTPAGGELVLAARLEPAGVVLEVRDGGPGLTSEDVAQAFHPGVLYERYHGVRPSGTGLGLAIVHGLVERLGGRIEAGHAPEGGARFTVRLPRHSPD
ncbi:MAG: HAMP domain-containing histidine kinase [Actinomycetota bacterium]|nr:HAMP domain-containing histidine kinase [Actinomycetota bacterium]